ncbi:MAG: dimethylmenaquinone methyltransferase [Roseibium sp.]|uniref:RraA family protein n=1 Tax=Roseibium sp. TaxID=1936156 RepID=UPI003D9BFEAE
MSVKINPAAATLSSEEIEAWREIAVSITVDLLPEQQIDPAIRPQTFGGHPLRLLGPALTVAVSPPDFGAVIHALDHVRAGDVVVIAAGGRADNAMIGEILGGDLREKGCAGIIVDGAVRDIDVLGNWPDFPVFSRSVTPRGPVGAAKGEINGSVSFGGCTISPGDLVMGDRDGLIAVPPDLARARLDDARAKLALEGDWIEGLRSGKPATDVFGL